MARPRTRKRPPQGTTSVRRGPLVGELEHRLACLADRLLYEIGDDDIWALRDALHLGHDNVVKQLLKKLAAKYDEKAYQLIVAIVLHT